MKTIIAIIIILMLACCNNSGSSTKSADTTTINTNTGNMPEGGPNHGLGDTNSYNRMNDTVTRDTSSKK
jgi:hypothetical protein